MIDKELLDILACPVCKSDVELITKNGQEKIRCKGCGRLYPVKEGIPIMLEEEAEHE